jgi:hypothetical protein
MGFRDGENGDGKILKKLLGNKYLKKPQMMKMLNTQSK